VRVKPFRIPRQIVMPGIVIHVHVLHPGHVDDEGDELPSRQADFHYDPFTGACRIRIASDLTLPEQRYALLHELQHFMTDYLHVAIKYHADLVKVS